MPLTPLKNWLPIKETLTKFFGQYRMNENVVSVLEVIGVIIRKSSHLRTSARISLSILSISVS